MLKKAFNKCVCFAMSSLPAILTALLVIHTNSTASSINGQPTPPATLKNYRKF